MVVAVLAVWTDGLSAAPPQWLAWSQQSATEGLRYRIFVDGRAQTAGEAACVGDSRMAECSAPLPTIAPGVHMLAVSVVDSFGNESDPSEPLTVTIDGPSGGHATVAGALASTSSHAPDSSARPATVSDRACAGQNCYSVSTIARGEGVISRLVTLPDGAVLLLRDGGDVLLLRSGVVATAYQLRRDDAGSSAIADIAVDPAFERNQFVYLAVVTTSADASSVRLVRARAVADRLAETATIVPDLPIGSGVTPRLTVTDAHLYIAIPVATEGSARQPYDGSILAFTGDGGSAGAAVGSPVLARGPDQPATLVRGAAAQVWIGAAAAADGLQLLRLSADGALANWRAVDDPDVGVLDLAFTRPDRGVLVTSSQALYEFSLAADGAAFVREQIDLGTLQATAVITTKDGDVVVATREPSNSQSVTLLSLRPSNLPTPR